MTRVNEQAFRHAILDVLGECRDWADEKVQAALGVMEEQAFEAMVDEHIANRLMQMLKSAGVIEITPQQRPPVGGARASDRLQQSALEGFTEGRERSTTEEPADSGLTKPETYEQLRLPGMEKF